MLASAWKVTPEGDCERCDSKTEIAVIRSSMMNDDRVEFVCSMQTMSFEGPLADVTQYTNLMVSEYDYCHESDTRYVITAGEFVPTLASVKGAVRSKSHVVFRKRSIWRRFVEWIND